MNKPSLVSTANWHTKEAHFHITEVVKFNESRRIQEESMVWYNTTKHTEDSDERKVTLGEWITHFKELAAFHSELARYHCEAAITYRTE